MNAVAGEVVAESKTNLNKSGFDDIKSKSESKTNLIKSGFDDKPLEVWWQYLRCLWEELSSDDDDEKDADDD